MDSEDYNVWVRQSRDYLDTAILALNKIYPNPKEVICYNASLSVEIILKAYILYNKADVPKIHDLRELYKTCLKYNANLIIDDKKLTFIYFSGSATKYPPNIEISDGDPKICIKYAEEVYNLIINNIK